MISTIEKSCSVNSTGSKAYFGYEPLLEIYKKRDSPEFLELIYKARKAKGWTQKDLAEKVGCSDTEISRFESGTKTMTMDMLLKMVEVLEIQFEVPIEGSVPDDDVNPDIEMEKLLVEVQEITGKMKLYVDDKCQKINKKVGKKIKKTKNTRK